MSADLLSVELEQKQFERVSRLLYRLCGIELKEGKEGLVKARLSKRLRALGLATYDQYLGMVERDRSGQELTWMIDALTTNKTSFFREARHFEFLQQQVLPRLVAHGGSIRFWSAGCSSGEEPYTLGVVLRESVPSIDRRDVKILATDISTTILAKAREGVYEQEVIQDVPAQLVQRYFTCIRTTPDRAYRINDNVKKLIRFGHLNLMEPWPMKGPFDVIFCRNVMIYFDKPTQQRLVHRFWELLRPGGMLFVGHSESLTASSKEFRYVQPAVYGK